MTSPTDIDLFEDLSDAELDRLADYKDADACECGGGFDGYDALHVECLDCGTFRAVDRSASLRALRDCGVIRASVSDERFYALVLYGDADYRDASDGKLDYFLTDRAKLYA